MTRSWCCWKTYPKKGTFKICQNFLKKFRNIFKGSSGDFLFQIQNLPCRSFGIQRRKFPGLLEAGAVGKRIRKGNLQNICQNFLEKKLKIFSKVPKIYRNLQRNFAVFCKEELGMWRFPFPNSKLLEVLELEKKILPRCGKTRPELEIETLIIHHNAHRKAVLARRATSNLGTLKVRHLSGLPFLNVHRKCAQQPQEDSILTFTRRTST